MGLLVEGQWRDKWYETKSDGKFKREGSQFRGTITPDQAEAGRYHLFISLACPWAHRTLIFRTLKQLDDIIDVTIVDPLMLKHGWEFTPGTTTPLGDLQYLYQVYTAADPSYTGRVTVPVLWDKHEKTIVNNESSEIIQIFNTAFDQLTGNPLDFYPEPMRADIDEINQFVYDNINNGVYKCGFATEQAAYDEAFDALFKALDVLEKHLVTNRYLLGPQITEADWRLFTTLIRFDAVYYGHFKTNLKRIIDYPNLFGYICELYQMPGIAKTVDMQQIKTHYYASHTMVNPTQIVPKGPALDFNHQHQRTKL